MNSEFAVLKEIWKSGARTYVKLISHQTGLGLDYIRYLCNYLVKKGQIKLIKGKRDYYEITAKGKKKLTLSGVIKEKTPRKISKSGKMFPHSRKLTFSLRGLPSKKIKVNLPQSRSETLIAKNSLITAEEKKLNLGKKIEKAVSFLRNI